jgi:hypothetical protein
VLFSALDPGAKSASGFSQEYINAGIIEAHSVSALDLLARRRAWIRVVRDNDSHLVTGDIHETAYILREQHPRDIDACQFSDITKLLPLIGTFYSFSDV